MTALVLALALMSGGHDDDGDVAHAADESHDSSDSWCDLGRGEGAVALGVGAGFGVVSLVAFQAGFEVERQIVAREVTGAAADDALFQRGLAAWIGWPTAALAVTSAGVGLYALSAGGE